MDSIREYVIDVMLKNIKDNIKVYYDCSDEYFNDLRALVETISENEKYLKYFIENQEPLIITTESTLTEINRLPYLYDFRDGI